MKKFIILFALSLAIASCGEPNHYDSHVGDEANSSSGHEQYTIQGRAPDSTVVVRDSSNTGIGDTTLERRSH